MDWVTNLGTQASEACDHTPEAHPSIFELKSDAKIKIYSILIKSRHRDDEKFQNILLRGFFQKIPLPKRPLPAPTSGTPSSPRYGTAL